MKMINEKSKMKTFISLIVLLAIMLMTNNVYAGMADFDDKTADAQANEQLANQEKAESLQMPEIYQKAVRFQG